MNDSLNRIVVDGYPAVIDITGESMKKSQHIRLPGRSCSSEGAIYEKAPHFREGLSGGADGARTHDLGRDRPAF